MFVLLDGIGNFPNCYNNNARVFFWYKVERIIVFVYNKANIVYSYMALSFLMSLNPSKCNANVAVKVLILIFAMRKKNIS